MEKLYFVFYLLYFFVCKCGGFSIIEITSSSRIVHERCNRTWQFTDHIDIINIPDKNSEPNDNCYCMIYHPTNQALLFKLIISVEHFNTGNVFTKWHSIPINGWKTDHYYVPVFNIRSSGSPNKRNHFYTHVYYRAPQKSTPVPVRITFEETGGTFTQPLHLSCNPDGYALPDILKRKQTTAAAVESTESRTSAYDTPAGDRNPSSNTDIVSGTYGGVSNPPCDIFTPTTYLTTCNCSNETETINAARVENNIGGINTAAIAVITCLLGIIVGTVVTSLIFVLYNRRKVMQLKEEHNAYLRLNESRSTSQVPVTDNNSNNVTDESQGNDNLGYTSLHMDSAGYSIADFPEELVRESVTDSVQYEQVDAYLDPVSMKQNLENSTGDVSVTNPQYVESDQEATA